VSALEHVDLMQAFTIMKLNDFFIIDMYWLWTLSPDNMWIGHVEQLWKFHLKYKIKGVTDKHNEIKGADHLSQMLLCGISEFLYLC